MMYGKNQRLVRNVNQLLILEELRKKDQSRSDLRQTLRLSGPSVSKNVDELIKKGLVLETGPQPSGLGRRPVTLKFNPRQGCVCAVELRVLSARLAIFDLSGKILDRTELAPYEVLDPLVLARIIKQIGKLLGGLGKESGALKGVTLFRDQERPVWSQTEADEPDGVIRALQELEKLIREKYNCPVFTSNRVCMAAVGEYAKEEPDEGMLYVFVGDSVSGAVVKARPDGIIKDGKRYVVYADAFDGIILDASTAVAEWRSGRLSQRNTLAEQVTTTAILRAVREKSVTGEGYLGEQFEEAESIMLKDIRAGAEKGDSDCLYIIQNAAVRLSVAAMNLSHLGGFRELVLDGPVAGLGPGYIETAAQFLQEALDRPAPVSVRWPALGDGAALYGAALCAVDEAVVAMVEEA